MGAPYTSVSVSGYNSNPPPDDGTQTEANRVKWSTIKEKLPDPLKTAVESINANIVTATGKLVGGAGVTSTAVNYTVLSTDQGKLVRASAASVTITTADATDVGSPFVHGVLNDSTGDITLDGSGSQTINGDASITIGPDEGVMMWTDGTNWFAVGVVRRTQVNPQGRLTPTSATPVIASDISGIGGLYYTPYTGNLIPIPNGTLFNVREFSELSLTLHANHLASTIYDIFAFDNSGTITLGTGPAWNTSTAGAGARGSGAGTTQLERLKGLLVNSVAMTARNGATTYSVAAKSAVYLGSIFIDATPGQVSIHTSYGQSRKCGLWNAYNRVPIVMRAGDGTASWTYNTNTIRQSNNAAGNTIALFTGLAEEWTDIEFIQRSQVATTGAQTSTSQIGIGLNSTTAITGTRGTNTQGTAVGAPAAFIESMMKASHNLIPSLGLNNINALEVTTVTTNNVTYYGTESNMVLKTRYLG